MVRTSRTWQHREVTVRGQEPTPPPQGPLGQTTIPRQTFFTSFWPFSARSAIVLAPILLALLLVAWAVARTPLGLEQVPGGWLLLGAVLLSLLPVLLMFLDRLALTGGTVEVGKVKVALTAAATAQRLVVALPNVAPGEAVGDSGSVKILDGLRRAQSTKILVVELEDGHAWWESRLLILCEGAVRLSRPEAIVFTATTRDKADQFVGWSHPINIRDRLLQSNPDHRKAYDKAMGLAGAARQELSLSSAVTSPALLNKQHIINANEDPLREFLEERLLADALSPLETSPREIGVGHLRDLLAPVLHDGAVDRTDLDVEWFRKALRSDEEYVAVTDSGVHVALMTRANIVSEVLLALTGDSPR
jgi:hypothetical protein